MKISKKYKFILPVLSITPVIAIAGISTACAHAQEDQGIDATKVTVYIDDKELQDQTEFDVKTVNKLQLTAKVEPAEANQDVTFEIIDQDGTGNIACSQTGIIYPNSCVGTITIKAISKAKNKLASDPITLSFYNSDYLSFYLIDSDNSEKEAYVACNTEIYGDLEEVVIPSSYTKDGVTYPVAGISYGGFNGCEKLRYVHFPQKTSSFKHILAYSFYECNTLKSAYLPDSVTMIDDSAFANCRSLTNLTLSKGLISISNSAFANCISIDNLELPESLTYIGAEAFSQCISIPTITIPANVSAIGEAAFTNCWAAHINVDEKSDSFMSDECGLYNKQKTRLLHCQYDYNKSGEYVVDDNIVRVDAKAFEYCELLKSIVFTENSKCTSIGESCFSLCTGLESCQLPKKISSIKASTFSYCWSLNEIAIPQNVSIIQANAFYGCDHLNYAEFIDDEQDNPVTWTVTNIASDPAMSQNWNVHYYKDCGSSELEIKFKNANRLRTVGYWDDPESSTRQWKGGFANCLWTKNNISISPVVPVGGDYFAYNTENIKSVNIGRKEVTLKIDFLKNVDVADGWYFNLYNEDGNAVCDTEVNLATTSTVPQTIEYKFVFNDKFATSKQISATIYKKS